jgi:hypothetical protein
VDLLVATAGSQGTTRLVLCEAKAYSPEQPRQIQHKVDRLTAILGEDGRTFPGVVPRLVLLAPKASPTSTTKGWPKWATREDGSARFVPLPPPEGRYSIHRQNSTDDWTWWRIVHEPWRD